MMRGATAWHQLSDAYEEFGGHALHTAEANGCILQSERLRRCCLGTRRPVVVGCIIVDVHDDTEENILLGEVRAIIPESIVVAADCVSFLVKIIPKLVADFISLLLQYGGRLLACF